MGRISKRACLNVKVGWLKFRHQADSGRQETLAALRGCSSAALIAILAVKEAGFVCRRQTRLATRSRRSDSAVSGSLLAAACAKCHARLMNLKGNEMTDHEGAWQNGGCHCGAVRFRVFVAGAKAIACNCSICAKKGMVNLIVTSEQFELIDGAASLSTYQFNTRAARHKFCKHCGIHPFSHPRSHPDGYDVNARCLDGGCDHFEVEGFDGQNWEASVASIQSPR